MNKFYRRAKKIFGWIFRRIYRVRIINPENEVFDKPYIVCCNHTAMMDVAMITLGMKTQVRYMAKKEMFKVPLLGFFAKCMGAFPIDRQNGDIGAMRKTIDLLKGGECVGIFPQGTRMPYIHPKDVEIKNGIGMFADRAGVGILPVCIRTKCNKLKLFRKTEFVIGKYLSPEELKFEGVSGKEKYQKISELAFSKVVELYGPDKSKKARKAQKQSAEAAEAK